MSDRRFLAGATEYKVQDGDTIKSIAEGAGITWQQLANFNWGTDNPIDINKFLRIKVGCRKKTSNGKNYIFSGKDDPGIIYIPKDVKGKSYCTSSIHTITVKLPFSQVELPKLKSLYSHKHLENLAEQLSEPAFFAMIVPIFGTDIKGSAYRQLYREVSQKSMAPPAIKVERQLINGHDAAYNRQTQTIHVHVNLVEDAIIEEVNDETRIASGKLFTALEEEYGHYIDDQLRNTYCHVGGDAKNDEGSVYAYNIGLLDSNIKEKIKYADIDHTTYTGPLNLNYKEAYKAVQENADTDEQLNDERDNEYEYFGARESHPFPGSYNHGIIERVLLEVGFLPGDLEHIYFGNWLRDFSQFIDPKIVRPEPAHIGPAQTELRRCGVLEALATFRPTRRTVTSLIAYIAYDEFHHYSVPLATYFKDLLLSDRGMSILECYRSEQHIDNPMPGPISERSNWMNYHLVDPYFYEPPTLAQLDLNPITKVRNYIATPTAGQKFQTSLQYMSDRLSDAVNLGYSANGMRNFGEALHVLEDFFAHSNFTEIALIKSGYTSVIPWVVRVNNKLPLVTGLFGSTDVIGSIAPKIAEKIPHQLPDYHTVTVEKTETDDLILLLLKDLSTAQEVDTTQSQPLLGNCDASFMLQQYRDYLLVRNVYRISRAAELEHELSDFHARINSYLRILQQVSYIFSQNTARLVDDFQTFSRQIQRQPMDNNPSHTQLAKDDHEKPLHDLAGKLAKDAVKTVGNEMHKCWFPQRHPGELGDPVNVAANFIKNPDTQETTWWQEIVRQWAISNPEKIVMAGDLTVLDTIRRGLDREVTAIQRQVRQRVNSVRRDTAEFILIIINGGEG